MLGLEHVGGDLAFECRDPVVSLAVAVLFDEPFRGVLTRDAELVGEHLCGRGRGSESDDGARPVLAFPCVLQCGEGGGLAGAGGADEQIEGAAGGGDRGDRFALAWLNRGFVVERSTVRGRR